MQIRMIGLGRMGAHMVRRLTSDPIFRTLTPGTGDMSRTPGRETRELVAMAGPHANEMDDPGTWGPAEVEKRIVPPDGWNNPVVKTSAEVRAA